MPALGVWGLRDLVSDPLYSYLYFIFWIFKDRFFRTRFLVISFPSSQPFHWSSSATSMPQMTLFFTFFCFFGKHTWVSMGLAGCSVGREKEGCVIGVGFKYPQKGQRSPHFQKVMNYVTPPAGPGGWSKARRWREGRLWSQMLPPRRSLEWFPWDPAPEACPESPHLAIPFGTLSSLSWPVLCLSAPSEAASSSSSSPSYPFTPEASPGWSGLCQALLQTTGILRHSLAQPSTGWWSRGRSQFACDQPPPHALTLGPLQALLLMTPEVPCADAFHL